MDKHDSLPEHVCRIILESTPSVHSFVDKLNSPYNSPKDKDLGFNEYSVTISKSELGTLANELWTALSRRHVVDFPDNALPTIITECLELLVSYSCITLVSVNGVIRRLILLHSS